MTYVSEQLSLFSPSILPTKKGNTKLVKYGIEEENTDYRIHVCGLTNICYVFETKKMIDYLKITKQKLREIEVKTYGVVTAKGYLVSIADFLNLGIGKEYFLPSYIWKSIGSNECEKNKGIWAVGIAKRAIEHNVIFFKYIVKEESNVVKQIQGQDLLIVNNEIKAQVKCDYRACLKANNSFGTGNLFIQTWECNPTKQF